MKQKYDIEDETGTEFRRKSINKEILKVKVDYAEKEEAPYQILSWEEKGYIGF